MHTLFFPDLPPDQATLRVEGDEARHALRVKRIGAGDRVRLVNGRGVVALAECVDSPGHPSGGGGGGAKAGVLLRIIERREAQRTRPEVSVWSATPKGPRIAELIDNLTQAGAASWRPMSTKLGVVDPRESKLARLERIVVEAVKQCGRAWMMEIGEKASFEEALSPGEGEAVLMADAGGGPCRGTGAARVRLLVGPEGGFTDGERRLAESRGVGRVSLGPHAMRIELAAAVGVALILREELAGPPGV